MHAKEESQPPGLCFISMLHLMISVSTTQVNSQSACPGEGIFLDLTVESLTDRVLASRMQGLMFAARGILPAESWQPP
jgi:hypothetical protein